MSEDILWYVCGREDGYYWRLVDRGQGICWTSYVAQDSLPQQRIIQPSNTSIAEVEKSCFTEIKHSETATTPHNQ